MRILHLPSTCVQAKICRTRFRSRLQHFLMSAGLLSPRTHSKLFCNISRPGICMHSNRWANNPSTLFHPMIRIYPLIHSTAVKRTIIMPIILISMSKWALQTRIATKVADQALSPIRLVRAHALKHPSHIAVSSLRRSHSRSRSRKCSNMSSHFALTCTNKKRNQWSWITRSR